MKSQIVDTIIYRSIQNITIELTRTVRILIVFLSFLSACFLLTLKCYIFVGILFVLLVSELIYLTIILKRKTITIYSGIGVGLVLLGHMVLSFNTWMYGIQKNNEFYDPVLLIYILSTEVMCLVMGFFYTRWCVRKGVACKLKAAPTTSSVFVLPGALGYFLSKYIRHEMTVHTQTFLLTTIFAVGSSMIMFNIGAEKIAAIYYTKKYNITNDDIRHME